MGRPSNATARRAQIVEGLMHVMATQGYHGATIQRIAQSAALTPGLLHYHFGDKRAILIALFERMRQALEQRYERYLDEYQQQHPDPRHMAWHALDAYIDAHLRVDEEDLHAPLLLKCWVQLGAQATYDEAINQHYQAHIKEDTEMLRTLIRLATPKMGREQRNAAATALYAMITGAYHLGVVTTDVVEDGSTARSARAMARALLAEAPEAT